MNIFGATIAWSVSCRLVLKPSSREFLRRQVGPARRPTRLLTSRSVRPPTITASFTPPPITPSHPSLPRTTLPAPWPSPQPAGRSGPTACTAPMPPRRWVAPRSRCCSWDRRWPPSPAAASAAGLRCGPAAPRPARSSSSSPPDAARPPRHLIRCTNLRRGTCLCCRMSTTLTRGQSCRPLFVKGQAWCSW